MIRQKFIEQYKKTLLTGKISLQALFRKSSWPHDEKNYKSIKLIAIHIPKTAGRSFRAILQNVYGENKVFYVERDFFKKSGILRKSTYDVKRLIPKGALVFHGHFTFAEISEIYEEQNVPIVTWVRDPVERVISNYYFFIKRIRSGAEPQNDHRRNETLLEYAAHEECQNRMSTFLDGITLQDLFFVGAVEHFAEDLQILADLLGWDHVEPVSLNRNKDYRAKFEPVSEDVRHTIQQLNAKDVALYQEALSLRKTTA